MSETPKPKKKPDNSLLWKYAGFASQLAVALTLAVFIGIKTDKWIGLKNPLLVWILPLLIIGALIYKVIKDTTPKN
jgi:hypothetical protein